LSNINLSHQENIIKSKTLFINISNANLQKEDKLQLNQDLEPQQPDPAWERYLLNFQQDIYIYIYIEKAMVIEI
jgi:hypothetical protein